MAFLDNSGDILLDAVLTDTGRFRMARGDFKISKFALGDDEIDYSLYNKNHPSGSSYYDLEVLKTPIMEALTNNTSTMKSKLLTITNNNLLFLPILRLHDGGYGAMVRGDHALGDSINTKVNSGTGGYIITVDDNTEVIDDNNNHCDAAIASRQPEELGIMGNSFNAGGSFIRVETGLDTLRISPRVPLPANLRETQFIIEMDDRFGRIQTRGLQDVPVSFIDDDQIASYYISQNVGGAGGALIVPPMDIIRGNGSEDNNNQETKHRIRGPRGNMLEFRVAPSLALSTSTYLFSRMGGTFSHSADNEVVNGLAGTGCADGITWYYIDTFVRVTAATTSYSIDIPIRFVKKQG